ncbi:lipase family protein [Dyella monticola]|uniref:Lipase family protein n=1 Tax=Dyella monticola TaxID=1927958 RepID=A0A370X549_9GAMM|nr:lipase family protein [Dyella monticola]RDS83544.1 lipase family protein [Dyella monticola]
MISDPVAAKHALLAMYAEDMLGGQGSLAPPIDPRCSGEWTLLGHLVAKNALLCGQKLQLGDAAYYGFVAVNKNDATNLIAVVRGTELAVEWLENFEGLLIDRPGIGWVEQGFDSIYGAMSYVALNAAPAAAAQAPAAAAIANVLPAGSTVTVIGHSLGAALASYLMLDLATVPQRSYRVEGSLFACPRAGSQDFVQRVDQAIDAYRVYNYMRDLVPHVPPSLPLPLNFESFPQTTWIQAADAQAVIKNDLECNHHAYCYAAMLDFASVTISPTNLCILKQATP